jgi:hypothetical protein
LSDDAGSATFRARVGGYVVDMVIFAAIAMIVVVAAGFLLLLMTDWAQADPSDAEFYTFLALIGFGTPLLWSLLNVALLASRSQTGGQYVAGIRMADEAGAPLALGKALTWWFCLNPLLFSWPMALAGGLPMAAVVALVLEAWTVFFVVFIVTLCAAAPVVAFVSGLLDPRNRALHDRVAGTLAVPA